MRVAHVTFSGTAGGAARAAHRIHSSLRQTGVESFLVSGDVSTSEDEIQALGRCGSVGKWTHQKVERMIVEGQRHSDFHMRSVAVFPGPASKALRRLGPDVVNLHLTAFGFMSVKQIGRLAGPVVWTLHDMWAFSGAEHYSDIEAFPRWKEGYRAENRCAKDRGLDLDAWTWDRKRRHWNHPIQLVTPSSWLARCSRKAFLTRDWPVRVIPYSIDEGRFPRIDRDVARRRLGISAETPVVAFGAAGAFDDPRKGWHLLREALEIVATRHEGLHVLVFGGDKPFREPTKSTVRWMGRVSDDELLACIYAASDVLALPSKIDNLPLVGMEAQQCGLRIVGFDVGGIPDLVPTELEGEVVTPFDVREFASKIVKGIQFSRQHPDLRDLVRESAIHRWSQSLVAGKYADLYEELLTEHV